MEPPRCGNCNIFGNSNDQRPKKVKVASSNVVNDEGFVEVTLKSGKGKQMAKHETRHIDGIRLSKPKTGYYYRPKVKPNNGIIAQLKLCIHIYMPEFKERVEDIEVSDVNRSGLPFTWNQKPKGEDGVLKKIDRIMSNLEFNGVFVGSNALFQPCIAHIGSLASCS
ncbi:RNA-directed DNA polymerase, eukaryota, Reverse transcriptase zinc-binding domain protein [Artemisia annua]|uniref:RNA-directed DNA polymerase, eukaryota, Reverse transcriptase zinc-binding domain protein n=1 Tax=Artemisia annua TaxID=35608 RepID=A0A2U1P132_ARTAN|nr:RNA-directed DNA polymerase, eukaryota, Reverse transcriptase zinc-binding domain protein [Artemisia annua]